MREDVMQEQLSQAQVRELIATGDYKRKFAEPGEKPKREGRYGKRHKTGEFNATEREYSLILESRKQNGEIRDWRFEEVVFQLARRMTYRPDFMIVHHDFSLTFIDTKGAGPISDTSIAKIKIAAKLFPWFAFIVEQKQSKANGGGWKRTEYKP